ncbi:Fibrocystin [Trichinella pseudospiralis]
MMRRRIDQQIPCNQKAFLLKLDHLLACHNNVNCRKAIMDANFFSFFFARHGGKCSSDRRYWIEAECCVSIMFFFIFIWS